jgi:hypothetical protein
MAKTASPYGLRLAKTLGEGRTNHGFNQYPIASAYATDLKTGDLVSLTAGSGTLQKETGTATATPVGVFIGCAYTDAAMGYLNKQMWKGGTVAADAMGYVIDNPQQVFQIQASATLSQNAVGTNAAIVQGAGNATLGISGVSLNAATLAATGTLPLRIVGLVNSPGFSTPGDAFTDVLVRINTHFNATTTGDAP